MDWSFSQIDWNAVDEALTEALLGAFSVLGELVSEQSTLGMEASVQLVVARELERLGFVVEQHAIDSEALRDDPASGLPSLSYEGRSILIGRRSGASRRSLLIQGHIDVVPAGEERLWSAPPFSAIERDGWLQGRGAADMKGGIAMAFAAIEALSVAAPFALAGELSFASVIEEECGGNGALAALLAGAVADGVLIPEPTDLNLLLGGVGVLWCEVVVTRRSAHAAHPTTGGSALDGVLAVADALRELVLGFEREDESTRDPDERYHMNVGTLAAGEWISCMPARATLGARIGFPTAITPAEASQRVLAAVHAVDPLAEVHFTGFRAEGYRLDNEDPFAVAIAHCHRELHGETPTPHSGPATNDARFYARRGVSAVCFGPRGRNLHGVDEAVEIASLATGARTLTRLIPHWLHGESP